MNLKFWERWAKPQGGASYRRQLFGTGPRSVPMTDADRAAAQARNTPKPAATAAEAVPGEGQGEAGPTRERAVTPPMGTETPAQQNNLRKYGMYAGIAVVVVIVLIIVVKLLSSAFSNAGSGGGGGAPTAAPTAAAGGAALEHPYAPNMPPFAVEQAIIGVVVFKDAPEPITLQNSSGERITLKATVDVSGTGAFSVRVQDSKGNGVDAAEPTVQELEPKAKFDVAGLKGHVDGLAYPGGRPGGNPTNQLRVLFDRPQANVDLVLKEGQTAGIIVQDGTEKYVSFTYRGGSVVEFHLYRSEIGGDGQEVKFGEQTYQVDKDSIEIALNGHIDRLAGYAQGGELFITLPLATFDASLEPTPVPTADPAAQPTEAPADPNAAAPETPTETPTE